MSMVDLYGYTEGALKLDDADKDSLTPTPIAAITKP
jgi:hypothetical protein